MTATADGTAETDVDVVFERWSYGEGYRHGRTDGDRVGFDAGYRAGFAAGVEIGGMQTLLGLEHVIGRDRLTELYAAADARVPHMTGWADYRTRTTYAQRPGRPDYPGWQTTTTEES